MLAIEYRPEKQSKRNNQNLLAIEYKPLKKDGDYFFGDKKIKKENIVLPTSHSFNLNRKKRMKRKRKKPQKTNNKKNKQKKN